jgi:hypothetical protein
VKRILALLLTLVLALGILPVMSVSAAEEPSVRTQAAVPDAAIVLKENWFMHLDPDNIGERDLWYQGFPGVGTSVTLPHNSNANSKGSAIAWYYTKFTPDLNMTEDQRLIAYFEGYHYYAKVWVNGNYVGDHEGGHAKFSFDLTGLIREDQENMIAIRLYSVWDAGKATIHGDTYKHSSTWAGTAFIQQPLYLTVVPDLAIADIFVDTKYESGDVDVRVIVDNPGTETVPVDIAAEISPNGQSLVIDRNSATVDAAPGLSEHVVKLHVNNFHPWSPDDPYLYSTNIEVQALDAAFADSSVIQVGFKDFRIDDDGYFMLNGERFYVKSLHTQASGNFAVYSNHTGMDMERHLAQFDYYKACGYNMVRFIACAGMPEMLDYCDKIGLLVYEENAMAWREESPNAESYIRRELRQMVERDRNHASLAIVGMLNETYDNEVEYDAPNNFRSGVAALDVVRTYDSDVLVLLGSGRWDKDASIASASNPGSWTWDTYLGDDGVQNSDGTYKDEGGDVHFYPRMPFDSSVRTSFASYGSDTKRAVFMSETGAGSQGNIISSGRIFQQETKGTFNTKTGSRGLAQIPVLYGLYDKHKMYEVYGTPELLIRASQTHQAEMRTRLIDYIRSNPRINGYSMTQGTDINNTGEGVLELVTDMKDGLSAALIDGWSDTRFCVNIDHYNQYKTETLDTDIYLSDLGALEVKEYTVRITVSGDNGVVWEKELPFTPQRDKNGNYVSSVQIFCDKIALTDLPAGEYRLNATLVGTKVSNTKLFWVADKKDLPKLSGTVYVIGFKENALSLMKDAGLDVRDLDVNNIVPGCTILLGGKNMKNRDLRAIYTAVEETGATVAVINPAAIGDWGYANIPLGSAVYQFECNNWLYHYDTLLINGTLFDGLPTGIMDTYYYEDVYTNTYFNIPVEPREALAMNLLIGIVGGQTDKPDLRQGVVAGAYDHGEGTIFVHTFKIMENLGSPVADRMMLNMINYVMNEC